MSDLINQQIKLKTNANSGMLNAESKGKPVFYFHGTPGSRFECNIFPEAANSVGARIIVADRPGYGLSDFQKGRRLLDWPNDVAELAVIWESIVCYYGLSGVVRMPRHVLSKSLNV